MSRAERRRVPVVRILAMNVALAALLVTLLALPGGVIWQAFVVWGVLSLCASWAIGVTEKATS